MMTHREALEVLAANRGDHVVITTMGSVALWPQLSDSPRDFHYIPSSMGQGVPLGLGLCLAKPGLAVAVLVGDGGLLMNLGCLVTAGQFAARCGYCSSTTASTRSPAANRWPMRAAPISPPSHAVPESAAFTAATRSEWESIARGRSRALTRHSSG